MKSAKDNKISDNNPSVIDVLAAGFAVRWRKKEGGNIWGTFLVRRVFHNSVRLPIVSRKRKAPLQWHKVDILIICYQNGACVLETSAPKQRS